MTTSAARVGSDFVSSKRFPVSFSAAKPKYISMRGRQRSLLMLLDSTGTVDEATAYVVPGRMCLWQFSMPVPNCRQYAISTLYSNNVYFVPSPTSLLPQLKLCTYFFFAVVTLCINTTISPSCIAYCLPSCRYLPASLTLAILAAP
jgi:hypothetical protein